MTAPTNHKTQLTPCDVRGFGNDPETAYGVYRHLNGTLVEIICQCETQPVANEIAKRINAHEPLLDELKRTTNLLRDLLGRFENGTATKLVIHKRLRSIEMTLEKFA